MSALKYVEILPSSGGIAKNLMIMAHGYGSNGENLSDLAKFLSPFFPDTIFLCPNAHEIADGSSAIDKCYQWFSLIDRSESSMKAGVKIGGEVLLKFIDAQIARLDMRYDKVSLLGFSQGTFVSLHAALNLSQKIAGVIGCSGGFIFDAITPKHVQHRPVVRLIHGDCDNVLPHAYSEAAIRDLSLLSINCDLHIVKNLGHTMTPKVMIKIVKFMQEFNESSDA